MAEETTPTPSKAAANANGSEDLSAEIARTISREPREQVTCRRISNDHYRCNWWTPERTAEYDNPHMSGMLVTTSRISKSQFLRVTKSAGALQITNLSQDGARSLVS
jgi:hypothetical protein